MAMGKAVVANDHPEQRTVIADSGGGLCVPYNATAFAAGIVELLMNPTRAKSMGLLGRHYVEKHRSYTVLADYVEQHYRELCAGKLY
jgi:glycosyltransferase involved in cell wall biosynthesis